MCGALIYVGGPSPLGEGGGTHNVGLGAGRSESWTARARRFCQVHVMRWIPPDPNGSAPLPSGR
jgi:hypothetical protein